MNAHPSTTTADSALEQDAMLTRALEAVERIRPIVEAHADEAERIGRAPDAVWRAMDEEGLFAIAGPRELGGWEADPAVRLAVFERMAYIDTSAGWTLAVGADDQGMIGSWAPDEASKLFFDGHRIKRGAIAFAPTGKAEVVDGGYRLSGRWQFASGIHHAEWVAAMAVIDRNGAPEPPLLMLLPVEDTQIQDNWRVGGLKGTGSNDFVVENVFVPEGHAFNALQPALRGSVGHRIGLPGFVALAHAAFALGAARRVLDEVTEIAKTKMRGYADPQGVAARGHFQWELGFHDTQLAAARGYVLERFETAQRDLDAGDELTEERQLELRITSSYATRVALEATRAMFRYAGAKSLFSGNVVERALRDITAASQHQIVSEIVYEEHGRSLLGYPNISAYA